MPTCPALTVSGLHLDGTIHLQQKNVLLIRRQVQWRITTQSDKSRQDKNNQKWGKLTGSQTYHSVETDNHTKYTARYWPGKIETSYDRINYVMYKSS